MKLYYVGGYVRDKILGLPSKDIDYAVEASSYEEMREYIASIGTIFLETPEYFTIRAKVGTETSDYVLCRKEKGYSDGRHPDVVEIGTIDDDLARRDFTMNAIAMRLDGSYYDPFQGLEDIRRGVIRCVRDTFDRFNEDPLRILRALRFGITKRMVLSQEIHEFLLFNLDKVDFSGVSIERKREELYKMFKFDTTASMRVIHQYRLYDILFDSNMWLMPTTKE